MALVKCRSCGAWITTAIAPCPCPQCGATVSRPKTLAGPFAFLLVAPLAAVLVLILVVCLVSRRTPAPRAHPSYRAPATVQPATECSPHAFPGQVLQIGTGYTWCKMSKSEQMGVCRLCTRRINNGLSPEFFYGCFEEFYRHPEGRSQGIAEVAAFSAAMSE